MTLPKLTRESKITVACFTTLITILIGITYWICCQFTYKTIVNYIVTDENAAAREELIISVSHLEGVVLTLQRLIPVYSGLIIVVILFLTWTQRALARATAIEEVNNNLNANFVKEKDKIDSLLEKAEDFVAQIEKNLETSNTLNKGVPFNIDKFIGDILSFRQELKKIEDNKNKKQDEQGD